MEFNFKLFSCGLGSVKGTEYSQLLPTARDEVIYQNFGCRTDQTSLWVDTTRHHQLHHVEDEHTYEEIKCESDEDNILNTNISAIELTHIKMHEYTTLTNGPLESTLEYPQCSTPLREVDNFHRMHSYPQTSKNNHTYTVNKKNYAHVLIARSSTTRPPTAHKTPSTSRRDVPVYGQLKDELSHSGYEADSDDTICGTQTNMCISKRHEDVLQYTPSCFPHNAMSGGEIIGIRPPCIGCEDNHHVPKELSNQTYNTPTYTLPEKKTCMTNMPHNKIMKIISRRSNYYKKHQRQMTTLATL